MAHSVTCPRGHSFEADSDQDAVCPECGHVVSMNGSDDGSATFRPADELPPMPGSPVDHVSLAPFQLTGFEILGELGRGGIGVVYRARQISLNRTVALKMLSGNVWISPDEIARFKTEADALAQLHHPNIVQIYEVGAKDGQPYLALELVDGGSLDDRLAGAPVAPEDAARLVEMLARAVQYAHERHVIHRDLKPANVLMQINAAPATLSSMIPKITDFGLAKRLDHDTGQTRTGSIMGTPSYMAPEQAAGKLDAIGPATDVYALGAILYEMLTGRPPFRAVTPIETVQQVLHDEPVPPRRLQSGVPLDLETICLKCLAKEPGRRYTSAAALADDLARYLAGQPILARPVSWRERTVKWVKRRPAFAGLIAASLVAVILVVGLVVGAYYNARLQTSLRLNERYRYLGEMTRGQRLWNENDVPRLLGVLDDNRSELRSFEWYYLAHLCRSETRSYLGHERPVLCIARSPTESLVASAGGASTLGTTVTGIGDVHLWDPDTGKLRHVLKGHTREVNAVAFSPDGKRLASADSDRKIRVWSVATGEELALLEGHVGAVTSLAFHPNGASLASGSRDGTVKIWDLATKMATRTLPKEQAIVLSVAFHPNGTRLLAGGLHPPERGESWEWDVATGGLLRTFRGHTGAVTAIAYHPLGKSFASAGDDRTIRVWSDPATHRVLQGHHERVTSLAFDARGTRLASGSADLNAIVWDYAAGRILCARKGHTDAVRGVTFNRDGSRLITASADRTVKVWNADGAQEFASLDGHDQSVTAVAFSPDSTLCASASEDHTIRIWETQSRRLRHVLAGHDGPVHCVAFIDGKRLASGGDDGTLRFWDLDAGKEAHRLDLAKQQVRALAISPDATQLAAAGVNGGDYNAAATITLFDVEQRRAIRELTGHTSYITSLAYRPDGKRLASVSADALKIWNAATGAEIASIPLRDATEPRVVWHPDGKRLAIANGDVDKGSIRILDADTAKETLKLTAHAGMAKALAFTPDGERLVATAGKNQVKLFDTVTGQEVLTLPGPTGLVRSIAFSTDGCWLAAGGGPLLPERGELILWHAPRK